MILRAYTPADCGEILRLFYETVHCVNAADYTQEQLDAWTDGADREKWNSSLSEHDTLVAEDGGAIVGFADLADGNYLDRLYVHKDFQRRGVATALCNALEKKCTGEITVHASITAVPFFERRGYAVCKKQQVLRRGVLLTNFVMKKNL